MRKIIITSLKKNFLFCVVSKYLYVYLIPYMEVNYWRSMVIDF